MATSVLEAAALTGAGSAAIPQADSILPPTSVADLDRAVAELKGRADAWVALGLSGRIELLKRLRRDTEKVAERWGAEAVRRKGITPSTSAEAEEFLGGPFATIRNLRLLERTLTQIRDKGAPQLPGKVTVGAAGHAVVDVFPTDGWDKAFYGGVTAEVWMQEGVTPGNLREHMGAIYKPGAKPEAGLVALVLGAGNVASIGPMDAFYKLFVEDQVVVLKMNPVNEYLGPIFAEAFSQLIDQGYLRIVYGGAMEGAHLCQHPDVAEIHITGSDKTHDAIVYGVGDEGRANKAADTPVNTKRISSELGNVSPVIVVPGPWSDSDLTHMAGRMASMLTNNAGFNCNATRVIVTDRGWGLRDRFLDAITKVFEQVPTREAYYPGAEQRFDAFVEAHPDAQQIGDKRGGRLPWTICRDVPADQTDDICFQTEAFCSVTAEVGLEASSPADYIARAVEFANDTLWGTLSCSIIVHPKSLKDPATKAAYDNAIADLRFGAVVVNDWAGLAYGLGSTTWGAYPGHTRQDIQSGVGVVHNTFLFDKPLKSVVYTPFKMWPAPPWGVLNRTSDVTSRRVVAWESKPGLGRAVKIIASALRG